MSDLKIKAILDNVNAVLGRDADYFNISHGETLVDDVDIFSITIGIEPKRMTIEDAEVIGEKQYLQIDLDEHDKQSLIIGEDTEVTVSYGNIYGQLYWGAVTRAL